jgi:hypothetical protein
LTPATGFRQSHALNAGPTPTLSKDTARGDDWMNYEEKTVLLNAYKQIESLETEVIKLISELEAVRAIFAEMIK